jgi:hypothetical protein
VENLASGGGGEFLVWSHEYQRHTKLLGLSNGHERDCFALLLGVHGREGGLGLGFGYH